MNLSSESNSYSLRRIVATDVPDVMEVRYSTTENSTSEKELKEIYGVTHESIAKAIKNNDTIGFLCENSGGVVGFSIGDFQTGEVFVVAVHPKHEGYGIGQRVLNCLCKSLFISGHEKLFLYATPDNALRAYGFYKHLGWQTEEKLSEDTEKMILNAKEFQSSLNDPSGRFY